MKRFLPLAAVLLCAFVCSDAPMSAAADVYKVNYTEYADLNITFPGGDNSIRGGKVSFTVTSPIYNPYLMEFNIYDKDPVYGLNPSQITGLPLELVKIDPRTIRVDIAPNFIIKSDIWILFTASDAALLSEEDRIPAEVPPAEPQPAPEGENIIPGRDNIVPGQKDVSPVPGQKDVSPVPGQKDVSPVPGQKDVSPVPEREEASPAPDSSFEPDIALVTASAAALSSMIALAAAVRMFMPINRAYGEG